MGAGVFLGEPNRVDYRKEVARGEVTAIYGTVFHFEQLMRQLPESETLHYQKLSALMVSGSTATMEFRQHIKKRLTRNLFVLWEANECHTATITRPSEVYGTRGGVGRPLPGFTVEVVDETGHPVPRRTQGSIRVSSPTMINGYLLDDLATSTAFVDGWFYTGDVGHMTPDGQLIHSGRADDLMIVNGINVYPAEVEGCLRSHPGVADAMVMSLEHRVSQDLPVALVELLPGVEASDQTLTEYVHNRLGRHVLYRLYVTDRIPRNQQGKVHTEFDKVAELSGCGMFGRASWKK